MLELGAIADEAHREVGRAVAALPVPTSSSAWAARMPGAVEAAREAGASPRRATLTTFEDTVAHLLKRLAAGRRRAGQGLARHAHGARGRRARGARLAREARTE